jgi:hypothetical protein
MKYLIFLLLICCIACNDGGSDPEFVKAETDLANAKREYEIALNENIRLLHIRDSLLRLHDSLQNVKGKMLTDFVEDVKKQDSAFRKEYSKRLKQ